MIIVNEKAKRVYWNYLIAHKSYWPYGFTRRRVEKLKKLMWNNGWFWVNIIYQHGGHADPRDIAEEQLEHCLGISTECS